MAIRKRPEAEFEKSPSELGQQFLTLESLTGGYNGYTDPELLSPQFWAAASNGYSGLHGTIRRARFAPVLNSTTTGYIPAVDRIKSIFGFAPPNVSPTVYFNFNATDLELWQWVYGGTAVLVARNFGIGVISVGTTMWLGIPGFIVKTDGTLREKLFYSTPILELWGLDAADVSPQITLAAGSSATLANPAASRTGNIATLTATAPLPANFIVGNYANVTVTGDASFNTPAGTAAKITAVTATTFSYSNIGPNVATSGTGGTATVQITKTVGRSYEYAWENVNTSHVSAPSPASQYVAYNNQTGTIDCIEVGTVTGNGAFDTYTGLNTAFSSAWVGRAIWVEGEGASFGTRLIVQVNSPTNLQINSTASVLTGKRFAIVDPQTTHIRLYATGDGAAVYFKVARNAFSFPATTPAAAGLEFVDTANSEPPNPPFTSEIAQLFNVPPPIGAFLSDYQGRVIVYGVAAALQSFFYSNIETTVIGQPPESFAPLNQVTLPVGDAQLNGMANLPTGLLIWSNHQDMFKLTGQLSDNTVSNQFQLGATIQRLPYKIGCASPYATAVTSLGAFWLSADREVWLFTDHYAPKNVGKPIQDILNRINGTRLGFARMAYYKRGDRNWLALALALDSSTFNNKLCLLDLDLLASNGQPSFFTFDMATNQPSWYLYDVNCESIATAYDSSSQTHLLAGDTDLITDVDYHTGDYTVTAEQANLPGNVTLHAFGNDAPHLIKRMDWMRVTTNQLPKYLASQGWKWNILTADDDTTILGVSTNTVSLIPGTDSLASVLPLEYSPAVFKFGGVRFAKGRRFQVQTVFPSGPGFWELRGFAVAYTNEASR